jgi:pyruvate-formate lyase-activating enzyme
VLIGLTRRCPLRCAHCVTDSTSASEEIEAQVLLRFVSSFGYEDPPEFMLMSGGEPMLRPKLVRELAERARDVGCRSMVLSGMFFARSGRIPPRILAAIDAVDNFSASLDVFHEREVPRANVLRVLQTLLDRGTDVSLHVVGLDADDPYLEEVTNEVRDVLKDRVPMVINTVKRYGRAMDWMADASTQRATTFDADPCLLAAWPTVGWDGAITACPSEAVVDGPAPAHLRLGHANDGWPIVQARCRASSMVRAIRLVGPEYIASRLREPGVACDGFCSTCMKLSEEPTTSARVDVMMARPSVALMESVAAEMQYEGGPSSVARRFSGRYAEMAMLGAPG